MSNNEPMLSCPKCGCEFELSELMKQHVESELRASGMQYDLGRQQRALKSTWERREKQILRALETVSALGAPMRRRTFDADQKLCATVPRWSFEDRQSDDFDPLVHPTPRLITASLDAEA
jgi:hypothetical protein